MPRDLHRAGTPDALIDPQNELPHFERPSAAAKKLDSERVAAMAMGAAVLAARVAALGEGLPRIERRNSASIRVTQHGL